MKIFLTFLLGLIISCLLFIFIPNWVPNLITILLFLTVISFIIFKKNNIKLAFVFTLGLIIGSAFSLIAIWLIVSSSAGVFKMI